MVHDPEGGEGVLSVPEVSVQDGGPRYENLYQAGGSKCFNYNHTRISSNWDPDLDLPQFFMNLV